MRFLVASAVLGALGLSASDLRLGVSDGKNIYQGSPTPSHDVVQNLGASVIYLETNWATYEPSKGQFDFSSLNNRIDAVKALGLLPSIRVKTCTNLWATGPVPPGVPAPTDVCTSLMPLDMNDYTDYVTHLVQNCLVRGVHEYAIQNEIDDEKQWPGTPQQYHQLLSAAYPAIKAVDPQAVVLDNAFTSLGIGWVVAQWYLEHGDPDRALAFAQTYMQCYSSQPKSLQDLQQKLSTNQWALAAWNYLVTNDYFNLNKDSIDVFQVHLYDSWSETGDVLQWLKDRMQDAGYQKPIACWECGVHMTKTGYDEQEHAVEFLKKWVIAMGEGVRESMYLVTFEPTTTWMTSDTLWTNQSYASPPLVEYNGSAWQFLKGGQAFQTLVAMTSGMTNLSLVPTVNGLTSYRIDTPKGPCWVAWSDGTTSINTNAAAYDMYGKLLSDGGVIKVTTQPVYLFGPPTAAIGRRRRP
jgi:hypothetical protein